MDSDDYRNAGKKSDAWKRIAETFGYDDSQDAKTAWKKLRDAHRDFLRRHSKAKGRRGRKRTVNWPYQKAMEFLLPYMTNRVPENYLNSVPIEKLCRPLNWECVDSLEVDDEASVAQTEESKAVENTSTNCGEQQWVVLEKCKEECENKVLEDQQSLRSDRMSRKIRNRHWRSLLKKSLLKKVLLREEASPLDKFFSAMCHATKSYPIAYQVEVKRVLFTVVTGIEERLGVPMLQSDENGWQTTGAP
ncbi:uncharacterized protein [Hetaerina americana]|uniref:uncharacterized protein n=1 Tax=Hetaerina americana TaxID=62018 RepID=UPI003A7F569D